MWLIMDMKRLPKGSWNELELMSETRSEPCLVIKGCETMGFALITPEF